MENLNVVKDLYELRETVKLQDRDITTSDYVKILDYKVDKEYLEEVTVSYIMEVYKYVEGEEALIVGIVLYFINNRKKKDNE